MLAVRQGRTMPYPFTMLRLASVACLGLFYLLPSRHLQAVLYYGLVFGHFALAIYYSRHKYKEALADTQVLLPRMGLIVGLTAMAAYAGMQAFPYLIILFGLHHVFSEVYMGEAVSGVDERLSLLFWSRLAMNAWAYVVCLRSYLGLGAVDGLIWYACLLPILLLGVVGIIGGRGRTKMTWIYDLAFAELAFLLVAMWSLSYRPLGFPEVVFFHNSIWMFYPGLKFAEGAKWSSLRRYAGLSCLSYGSFALVVHYLMRYRNVPLPEVDEVGAYWALIHIMLSLATSPMNPKVLRQVFRGAKKAAVADMATRAPKAA